MSKIRTVEQLYDGLANDLAWRQKELSTIRTLVASSKELKLETTIRSGIALTYAHFEGYIKKSVELYFNFLTYQKLRISEVTTNIVAVEVKSIMEKALSTHSIQPLIEVIDFLRKNDNKCSNLLKYSPYTGANLNYDRLNNIADALNIEKTVFINLKQLIDENLLSNRNSIAHGEYVIMDEEELNEIQKKIILILIDFKDQITNIAALKKYKV